jgi:Leucine-rich repeat (LRR) protein
VISGYSEDEIEALRLREQFLRNPSLKHLTTLLRQMTWLETVDLSGMGLTALPPEIGQLTSLQTLDLSNNMLTGLPPVS